eukprot:1193151-Prorocentrum_minimum.AAC.1
MRFLFWAKLAGFGMTTLDSCCAHVIAVRGTCEAPVDSPMVALRIIPECHRVIARMSPNSKLKLWSQNCS